MYKGILKSKNLSVTKQRLFLLEALDKIHTPVTIEQFKKIHPSFMDESTIYRSLKKLVDHGIVYQTDFREGASYFEFQYNSHHHHITCTECKSREKIDACLASEFTSIEKKTGYTVTNHMVEIFGTCKNCSLSL